MTATDHGSQSSQSSHGSQSSHTGRVRALVLDYGGVLTPPIAQVFGQWAAGDQVTRESFEELFGRWRSSQDNPMHDLETGVLSGADFSVLLSQGLRRDDGGVVPVAGLLDRMFAGLTLERDALVMLSAARSAGLRTALLSNSWAFDYPWADLDPLLDVRVISGEEGMRKPDAAIYRLTAERLGVELSECAFVDDAARNVEAAQELGMYGVVHTDLPSTLAALVRGVPELAPYLPDVHDLPPMKPGGTT